MKRILIHIVTLVTVVLLAGCEKFLDVPPEKKNNLEIKTAEALDMLLNNYNVIFDRSREVVLAHDNYGIYKDYYLARPSRFDGQLNAFSGILIIVHRTCTGENEFLKLLHTMQQL